MHPLPNFLFFLSFLSYPPGLLSAGRILLFRYEGQRCVKDPFSGIRRGNETEPKGAYLHEYSLLLDIPQPTFLCFVWTLADSCRGGGNNGPRVKGIMGLGSEQKNLLVTWAGHRTPGPTGFTHWPEMGLQFSLRKNYF